MERLTYNIEQAGVLLGISRATAYMLARSGQLPVIFLGKRRMVVPKIAIDRMLNRVQEGKPNEQQPRSQGPMQNEW